jgi:hypothetical protein
MADGPSVGRGDRRRPRARRHAPARNLTTNGHVTGNPQSKQAENLFQQRFPPDKNAVDELIVVRSAAHTVNDPAFTSFLTRLGTKAAATGVVSRYSALGVSRDRHAAEPRLRRAATRLRRQGLALHPDRHARHGRGLEAAGRAPIVRS